MEPWLDAENLLPGENWEIEIPKALFDSDVILVCLSKNSINKEGYVQKEITFAIDKALEKPDGTIFIVPAKLEECDVPQRLNRYQWVDLYHEDGRKRLMLSLNKRAAQLGTAVEQVVVSDSILEQDKLLYDTTQKNEEHNIKEKAERAIIETLAPEKEKLENSEKIVIVREKEEHNAIKNLTSENSESEITAKTVLEKIVQDRVQTANSDATDKIKKNLEPVGQNAVLPYNPAQRKLQNQKTTNKFNFQKIEAIGIFGIVLILAGFLFYKINQIKSSPTTLVITATSFPTVPAGFLFVGDLPEGASAQLTSPNRGVSQITLGQIPVAPGSQIDVLSGIISIGLPDGSALYLTEGTSLKFVNIMDPNFPTKETVLSLSRGAILVKVVSGVVSVQAFDGIVAQVRGSIMGVQLSDKHYVDCYEGHCSIYGYVSTPIESMEGERRYLSVTSNNISLSNSFDRCQNWESMLGIDIYNALGLQACVISTPNSIKTPNVTTLAFPTDTPVSIFP